MSDTETIVMGNFPDDPFNRDTASDVTFTFDIPLAN